MPVTMKYNRDSGDMRGKRYAIQLGPPRPDEELRHAQRALAHCALEHPRLGCIEAREAELEEVLAALGLLRKI